MKWSLEILIILFVIPIIITYLFLLFFDCVFGLGIPIRRRIKKREDKYFVQEKWILSPFWSDLVSGDLMRCVFDRPSYSTLEAATKAMEDEE